MGKDFEGELKDAGNSAPCEDNNTHWFCISKNGSVTNNYWFSENMKGFLLVPVMVIDGAGNDTANLKVRFFFLGGGDGDNGPKSPVGQKFLSKS